MNSNTDFLNTSIEFLPTKRFDESLFQARLQTSRLKKKERQKKRMKLKRSTKLK